MSKNYSNKLKWVKNLEWYVLNHNFTKDSVELFNIFSSSRFISSVKELIDKYTTFEDFEEELCRDLSWCFRGKSEYEILCSGLFGDNTYKIDVYSQIVPNLDVLAKYIITEANKHKRKKLVIE